MIKSGSDSMYWDKLKIVFLSELVSSNDGTTNCQIATYILSHIDEVKKCTISELAERCHVANSSISRFCKEIGLNDFTELKELINTTSFHFDLYSTHENIKTRSFDFITRVKDSLDLISESLNYEGLNRLAKDLDNYEKIGILGLLKAETAAINLQSDLLLLGKVAVTKVSFKQQLEYIKNATDKDLIIIFSFTGIYFEHTFPRKIPKQQTKPKIYFITSDYNSLSNEYFDEVIFFKSLRDYASHPFQLQLVGSIIAQNFAYYLAKKKIHFPNQEIYCDTKGNFI
jgi:DNA-binding MurR/RpiR family transcriptional regulator